MARDIEEFLKMAAKRRQQQKQKGGGPAARQRPPQPASPASPPRTPPPVTRRPPVQRLAGDDEIQVIGGSHGQAPAAGHQSVAEHVQSYIDTSSLAEHAAQLGEEVGLADDKLNARLQSTFDHDVGHLKLDVLGGSPGSATTSRGNQAAAEMREMLRNPKSIRQAIVISEVLKRPDFD